MARAIRRVGAGGRRPSRFRARRPTRARPATTLPTCAL